MADWHGAWELHIEGDKFWGLILTEDIKREDGTISELEMTCPETGQIFKLPPAELKNVPGGIIFKGIGMIHISETIFK